MSALIFLAIWLFSLAPPSLAAEKFKFGISVRTPGYELTAATAQERGFWKDSGLDVEVFAFSGGGPFTQAMAAKAIIMGFHGVPPTVIAVSRGMPVIMVGDLYQNNIGIWVDAKSPIKESKDLAGARIGLSSLGSTPHAYGQGAARALGLEDKIRFVAVGGIPTRLAALKTGAIDGHISPYDAMARFQQAGEAREIVRLRNYLPAEVPDSAVAAHKEAIANSPAIVGKGVQGIIQAVHFLRDNSAWGVPRLAQMTGHPPAVAKLVYEDLMARYTKDGKISTKGLENLILFLVEYKLLTRDKAPRVEDVYTSRFVD